MSDRLSSPAGAVPGWLLDVAACPADRGRLTTDQDFLRCTGCGRRFGVADGIVALLPDALARPASEEMAWWEPHYAGVSTQPYSPRRGLRGRARERHLIRHLRAALGPRAVVAEMGAGPSRTVAGLWPPQHHGTRYVATDLARQGLAAGAQTRGPGTAAVQCDAGAWPFRDGALDAVLILGVLHHLPDWQGALRSACRSVRPGGFVALHEVIYKPRVLAGRRRSGYHDSWTSPHEGHVQESDLLGVLGERGRVLRLRRGYTPLQFALVQFGDLHDRLERSRTLTVGLDLIDQGFGQTFGRLRPSLGFAEVLALWQAPRV